MIKNRTAQIVFQTIYLTFAVIGIIGGLGYFNRSFDPYFYIYYTNLSNYVCMAVMAVAFCKTVKNSSNKEDGAVSTAPKFTFCCVILIMVTFLVYNILFAGEHTVSSYFLSLGNVLMHAILPIMFILHWVLFYEHGNLKWFDPLLCTIMPLIYVAFILIRATIMKSVSGVFLYPYFFLNVEKLGVGGVFMWIGILVAIFVLIGYILYFLDNIKTLKQKLRDRRQEKKKTDGMSL